MYSKIARHEIYFEVTVYRTITAVKCCRMFLPSILDLALPNLNLTTSISRKAKSILGTCLHILSTTCYNVPFCKTYHGENESQHWNVNACKKYVLIYVISRNVVGRFWSVQYEAHARYASKRDDRYRRENVTVEPSVPRNVIFDLTVRTSRCATLEIQKY